MLIGFGLFQMLTLFSARRLMQVGPLSFVLPFLVLAAGVFLVSKPAFVGEAIGVVAGASLIVYGVSELLSSWKMREIVDNDDVEEQ